MKNQILFLVVQYVLKQGKELRIGCPDTYIEYFLKNTIPGLCNEHFGIEVKENTNNTTTQNKPNEIIQGIIHDIDVEDPQQVVQPQHSNNSNNNINNNIVNNTNSNKTNTNQNNNINNNTTNVTNTPKPQTNNTNTNNDNNKNNTNNVNNSNSNTTNNNTSNNNINANNNVTTNTNT